MALRISVEQLEALRYKLRMFRVPIDGPADVYCDNQSVVDGSSLHNARYRRSTMRSASTR